MTKQTKAKIVAGIFVVVLALIIVLGILGMFGIAPIAGKGCYVRYADSGSNHKIIETVGHTVTIRADGNYDGLVRDGKFELDPDSYGKWVNSQYFVYADPEVDIGISTNIKMRVSGKMSLCRGYLLEDNLQQDGNLDAEGNRIPIPRVEEEGSGLALLFDAKTYGWRNALEVYPGDRVQVTIDPPANKENQKVTDAFGIEHNDDCSPGKEITSEMVNNLQSPYKASCGVFSPWGRYFNDDRSFHVPWSCSGGFLGIGESCSGGFYRDYFDPIKPYLADGSASQRVNVFDRDQATAIALMSDHQGDKFWFEHGFGLIKKIAGGEEMVTYLPEDSSSNQVVILDTTYTDLTAKSNLQYSFFYANNEFIYNIAEQKRYTSTLTPPYQTDAQKSADNSGGYVVRLKQTKCQREQGSLNGDDPYPSRGQIQMAIVPPGKDPNIDAHTIENFTPDVDGNVTRSANDKEGYVWFRVDNRPEDYPDSFGSYIISFLKDRAVKKDGFVFTILEPLFSLLGDKLEDTSQTIFKNMTCYQFGDQSQCNNFFNYIRGLLTLYIVVFGLQYLMGMIRVSHEDLLIRVAKIALVAGLINEGTFLLFHEYFFKIIFNFSNQILSNIGGLSMFNTYADNSTIDLAELIKDENSSKPKAEVFLFLEQVLYSIFMNENFIRQLLGLIGTGLAGILYFIITVVALVMFLITIFRCISIYLMSFLGLALLVSLAPLFLTFILFDQTRSMFDNWLKYCFRFAIEPAIVLIGAMILTQLFTIALDQVLGYSVCWKCAIPIKLPFPQISVLPVGLLNQPIACLYWFGPWGHDASKDLLGLDFSKFAILLMITYAFTGYVNFADSLVDRLTGGIGQVSATKLGGAVSQGMGNVASKYSTGQSTADNMADLKKYAKARTSDVVGGAKDGKLKQTLRDVSERVGKDAAKKSGEMERNVRSNLGFDKDIGSKGSPKDGGKK